MLPKMTPFSFLFLAIGLIGCSGSKNAGQQAPTPDSGPPPPAATLDQGVADQGEPSPMDMGTSVDGHTPEPREPDGGRRIGDASLAMADLGLPKGMDMGQSQGDAGTEVRIDAGETPPEDAGVPDLDMGIPLPEDAGLMPPDASGPFDIGVLPPADLRRLSDGGVVQDPEEGITIEIDPSHRTPASAYGGCATIVMQCFRQRQGEADACINGLRRCMTEEPWLEDERCCSETCFNNFIRNRQMGMDLGQALRATFIEGRDCMPGVGGAR